MRQNPSDPPISHFHDAAAGATVAERSGQRVRGTATAARLGGMFAGHSQREALARIEFLAGNSKSLGILVGESQTGKSTLLRHLCLRGRLARWNIDPIYLHAQSSGDALQRRGDDSAEGTATITAGMLQQIASVIGLASSNDGISLHTIQQRMDAILRTGVRLALLIDDASKQRHAVVQLLQSLGRQIASIPIILTCQRLSEGRLLSESIGGWPLRIELATWPLEDVRQFIAHQLHQRGLTSSLINDQAIVRIHELSDGYPGRVDRLLELALHARAGHQLQHIPSNLIDMVASELMIG
jgi:type II secretory pathway predicted ATPase ExeA